MATKKSFRLPPGYGSVTKLSGNRRRPYMVKVNTTRDERGYPQFDILGYYEDRPAALQALAEYNRNPYNIKASKATFKEVYEMWFDQKYNLGKKKLSKSTMYCTQGAFKKCAALHDMVFADIRTIHMQAVLDDFSLSHAYMEHIKNLFNQMGKYALEYDIIQKDYSQFVKINKEDDDEHGVPFSKEDIEKLWTHKEIPFADTILIFIYSGWRINELLKMPLENIDLQERTFQGGLKTNAGKHRIVPIHSKIYDMVAERHIPGHKSIIYDNKPNMTTAAYYKVFNQALKAAGITEPHTPHDCRHTFATLLNNAGANPVAVKKLMGHSSNDITERIYTHKDIEDLRKEIEKI